MVSVSGWVGGWEDNLTLIPNSVQLRWSLGYDDLGTSQTEKSVEL